MSSPITINYPASASRAYQRSDLSSSPGLYVPIHRRAPRLSDFGSGSGSGSGSDLLGLGTPSSYTSTSESSRSISPAPSSMRSISPAPHMNIAHSSLPIYTPADLLLLSNSPLSKLSPETRDTLRAIAPEVVWSRKQRKAQEWRTRHPQSGQSHPQGQGQARSHGRTASHASSLALSSEEEDERAVTWRRV